MLSLESHEPTEMNDHPKGPVAFLRAWAPFLVFAVLHFFVILFALGFYSSIWIMGMGGGPSLPRLEDWNVYPAIIIETLLLSRWTSRAFKQSLARVRWPWATGFLILIALPVAVFVPESIKERNDIVRFRQEAQQAAIVANTERAEREKEIAAMAGPVAVDLTGATPILTYSMAQPRLTISGDTVRYSGLDEGYNSQSRHHFELTLDEDAGRGDLRLAGAPPGAPTDCLGKCDKAEARRLCIEFKTIGCIDYNVLGLSDRYFAFRMEEWASPYTINVFSRDSQQSVFTFLSYDIDKIVFAGDVFYYDTRAEYIGTRALRRHDLVSGNDSVVLAVSREQEPFLWDVDGNIAVSIVNTEIKEGEYFSNQNNQYIYALHAKRIE